MSNGTIKTGRALRDPGGVTHIASWTDPEGITHVAHRMDRIITPEYATVFCGSLVLEEHRAPWSSVDCMSCIVARDRFLSDEKQSRLLDRILR